ncbi:MAG TPA: hypothetical protein VGR71_03805 [Nitrospira sp.]|nr:hypothetical protein [Nitrospira sp.]
MIRAATPDPEIVPPANADKVFSGTLYPWDEWLDGKARYLTMRDHFPNFKSLESFIKFVRLTARKRSIRVQIRRDTRSGQIMLRAKPQNARREATNAKTETPPSGRNLEAQGTRSRRTVRDRPPAPKRRE